MKRKILSIFLCISLLVSLLSACNEGNVTHKKPKDNTSDNAIIDTIIDNADNTEGNVDTKNDAQKIKKLEYIEEKIPVVNMGESLAGTEIPLYPKGKIAFRIIRSADASNKIIGYAAKIKSEIKERLNITAEYKPDTVVERSGLMEVIIGDTNRGGYTAIYNDIVKYRIKYLNDWTIKVDGNKIFIVGGSEKATEQAVNYFIERFCSSLGAIISSEYCYKFKKDLTNCFTINGSPDIDNYSIIMPKYNLSYIVGRELDNLSEALLIKNCAVVEVKRDNTSAGKYEIIAGSTNRGSLANINDRDKWQITVKGSKVYLEGGHDYSTAMAVLKFIDMVESGKSIKDGDIFSGKYSESIKEDKYSNYYRLAVSDEFEGDTLNSDLWQIDDCVERRPGDPNLWGDKISGRSKDNVSVRDGKLVGKATYTDTNYWGFKIHSHNSFWYEYGLIEISCKIPMGPGLWSGFWAQGNVGTTNMEYDFFESGADYDAIKMSALKNPNTDGYSGYNGLRTNLGEFAKDKFTWYRLQVGEFNKYFHTIGMEWDSSKFSMVCDGRVLYTVDYSNNGELCKAVRQLVYVQISTCVDFKSNGSGVNGSIPETFSNPAIPGDPCWTESNEYIVEYFHLFQKPGSKLSYVSN